MIRVGVVRGGVSHQYNESLQTGANVLRVLREHFPSSYKPVDILITRDGTWHIAGRPVDTKQLKDSVDMIWNALHGAYGEDGSLATQLESLGIPYTGSGPVASAISTQAHILKEKLRELGSTTLERYVISEQTIDENSSNLSSLRDHARAVFLSFPPPWAIRAGNGLVNVARTREALLEGLQNASNIPGDIIVEEYKQGRDASVLILDQFRGKDVYSFLPVGTMLSRSEKQHIEKHALDIYRGLGLRQHAQLSFTITPKHTYINSIQVVPEIHDESNLYQSLQAVGVSLSEFIDHSIQSVVKK